MPSYTEKSAAIVKNDRKRREDRKLAEDRALGLIAETDPYDDTRGAYINPELIRGSGVVTPRGMVRHTRPYGSLAMGRLSWAHVSVKDAHKPPELLASVPMAGVAVGVFGEDFAFEHNGRPVSTVRITLDDGTVTFRTLASFRKERAERKNARPVQNVPTSTRKMAKDLAPIGQDYNG